MDADFSSLEKKVDDVAAFCRTLRDENHILRDRVAGLEQEKQSLAAKMEQARLRVEALMDRLPAE
jgi:cell division protein ZapB